MDCRAVLCMAVILAVLFAYSEGRTKKVVIHVPFKVKKIKHTHTVFKTIHHHHPHIDHAVSPSDEHEHFHHMHIHEDLVKGQHSQPVPGLGIPEFLPDVPIELPIDLPDVPQIPGLSSRHVIPLYRRT